MPTRQDAEMSLILRQMTKKGGDSMEGQRPTKDQVRILLMQTYCLNCEPQCRDCPVNDCIIIITD